MAKNNVDFQDNNANDKNKFDSQISKNDKISFNPEKLIDQNIEDLEDGQSNMNFFHIFPIHINDLWNLFKTTSIFPTFFL